jgi:hypothetical protein
LKYNKRNLMTDLSSVPVHSPSVVTRKTGNDYVLIPVSNNIADMDSVYTLNETGTFIWEHIDGKNTILEIIDALTQEFEINKDTATEDVLSIIDCMKRFLIIRS